MKNRVNLYHPEFHPKLRLLTLTLVVLSWVFTALIFGSLHFYLASEQQGFKSKIAKIEQNKQQQTILLNELKSAVDNIKIDPKLLKQVQKKQQLIALKKRVLNELAGSSSFVHI